MSEDNLLRIDTITAYISSDETGEGILGARMGDHWMPLIGADDERIQSLRSLAEAIAAESRTTVKVVRFSVRTELDVIEPPEES